MAGSAGVVRWAGSAGVVRWAGSSDVPVAPVAVGQQQHDLFQNSWEYPLFEQHQSDGAEPVHQELPDPGGVIDGQQLRRQHQGQPPARALLQAGVHGERGPRRRQVRQAHPGAQRRGAAGPDRRR
nr:hypothetical protein [Mycolicibacterium insubricum]